MAETNTSPAQKNASPDQANASAAQADTSPNPEEPPLLDIHEIGEANQDLLDARWPPVLDWPSEEKAGRYPRWVQPPTIPDPRTWPGDPRETGKGGQEYIKFKATQIHWFLDGLVGASSASDDEIRRCIRWLAIVRGQLERELKRTTAETETAVEDRKKLGELIARVKEGQERALWFLNKGF